MSEQYNELLSELKKHYDNKVVQVYVPSINKFVDFKPINVKQQKEFVTGLTDLSHANLDFNISTNNAIKDNIVDKDINILSIDKPSILLSLRAQLGEKTLKIEEDDELYTINIPEFIDKYEGFKFDDSLREHVIKNDDVEIYLSIPDLNRDTKTNKFIKKALGNNTSTDGIYRSIGELFVYELIKFIDKIVINKTEVTFSELTFDQQIQVCETFSLDVSHDITKYIAKIRDFENQFTTHVIDGNKVEIPMTIALFTND